MSATKKLLFNSSIVFVGTFIGSVFSYLFNMLMGRQLGPTYYGEMTALLSLWTIASVAGGAIVTVSMRYSSELYAENQYLALKKLFLFLSKYVFIFGLVVFIIGLILVEPIKDFLSIGSFWPIIITLSAVVFTLLSFINKGFLQGIQKFGQVSFIGILDSSLRLGLGLGLVALGFSLNGAMSGVLLATAIVYFYTFFPLRKVLRSSKSQQSQTSFKFDKKEIISYSWPTLIAAVFLVLATNLDIVLVKHYFSPEQAGLYSAVSTIAKIIIYITAPVIPVMFPMVSAQQIKGEKHYRIFLFSIVLALLVSLAVLAIYIIAPQTVISILYGSKYLPYYALLPLLGVAFLFYSLINIIVNYYLAIKNFVFLWFFGLILGIQLIVVSFWHPSLESIAKTLIMTNGALFVLMFGYYLLTKKQQIIEQLKNQRTKENATS